MYTRYGGRVRSQTRSKSVPIRRLLLTSSLEQQQQQQQPHPSKPLGTVITLTRTESSDDLCEKWLHERILLEKHVSTLVGKVDELQAKNNQLMAENEKLLTREKDESDRTHRILEELHSQQVILKGEVARLVQQVKFRSSEGDSNVIVSKIRFNSEVQYIDPPCQPIRKMKQPIPKKTFKILTSPVMKLSNELMSSDLRNDIKEMFNEYDTTQCGRIPPSKVVQSWKRLEDTFCLTAVECPIPLNTSSVCFDQFVAIMGSLAHRLTNEKYEIRS